MTVMVSRSSERLKGLLVAGLLAVPVLLMGLGGLLLLLGASAFTGIRIVAWGLLLGLPPTLVLQAFVLRRHLPRRRQRWQLKRSRRWCWGTALTLASGRSRPSCCWPAIATVGRCGFPLLARC